MRSKWISLTLLSVVALAACADVSPEQARINAEELAIYQQENQLMLDYFLRDRSIELGAQEIGRRATFSDLAAQRRNYMILTTPPRLR